MKDEWENLKEIVAELLKESKKLGVDAAEMGISSGSGLSVSVRLGETETIEFNRDKSFGITVYKGKRKGSVSTSDLRLEALRASLEAACRIAKYTEEDACSGLAESEYMAKVIPDLNLYHPWEIKPEDAILLAKECEASALKFDEKITNSEGASFSTHTHYRVYGNTHGFIGAYPSTLHSLSCVVIAKAGDCMQRDYDYTTARNSRDLDPKVAVGQKAALRTLRRLNARKIKTCKSPVIFSSEIAGGLLKNFIAAISGGNLYRKSSFLLNHLDKQVFPDFISIEEQPHLLKGLGSAPFDQEGVATKQRVIVEGGILRSYVLSSYSARKLNLRTTGNCGGVHNLVVSHQNCDLAQLLKEMNTGFLVTELMGHGVNLVTGDYSRGATGFWVENGEIQYPIEEVTIAGNMKEMFRKLVAIGNDTEHRSNILTGSIWIDNMTIAGT